MFGTELRERLQAKRDAPGATFEGTGKAKVTPDAHEPKKTRLFPFDGPVMLLLDDILAVASLLFATGAAAYGHALLAIPGGILGLWLAWRVLPPRHRLKNVRIVCISDTHGCHRDLDLPKGDILIHAGDFTHFGKIEDAEDFNEWLGSLPFEHKIVVNGNHENKAPWQARVAEVLSNACFLKDSSVTVKGLHIYGTDFCWPMKTESPLFALIPKSADVVIAHGPTKGLVDGGMGCRALLWALAAVRPRLTVSGHIHEAHGQCEGRGCLRGTTFVNAANCRGGYSIGWGPIVVDL